jgi:hypothetical protein
MRNRNGTHRTWLVGFKKPIFSCEPQGTQKRKSLLLVLFVSAAGFAIAPGPASAVVQSPKVFAWSMPDRLLVNDSVPGHDPDDPIPRYDPSALMLPPGGWTVNFDACASSSSNIVQYEWFVDGVPVATSTNCRFSHQFPEEYQYQVSVRLTDDVGDSAVVDETITVQDWLIIAVGDSYGSGEGNPEKPVTAQANVDFSVLDDLASSVRADLQAARDQLPGREEAQAAAQQLNDDALATYNQALADLNQAKQDLQAVVEIQTNVEGDPTVVNRRNAVEAWQQEVAEDQAQVNRDHQDYDNCSGIPLSSCGTAEKAARLVILNASKAELAASKVSLATAETALLVARDAAVVIYSAITTVQNFTVLVQTRTLRETAVNLAQNSFNSAKNAYDSAAAALQQAVDAVASLQGIITDLQDAWDEARLNAATQYLDHLPVWTSTPPSWGTPEPTFAQIVLEGATPGEALRCHRSMISGQARAALALEKADPHTSVTLVHLSCSGATITKGLKENYEGQEDFAILEPLLTRQIYPGYTGISFDRSANKIESQLVDAAIKTEGREVDALLISIGGNDIGFATIIESCVLSEPCHLDLPPSTEFNEELRAAIEGNCRPVNLINEWTGLSLPAANWFPFSDKCLATYDLLDSGFYSGCDTDKDGEKDDPCSAGVAKTTFSTNILDLPGLMDDLNDTILAELPGLNPSRVYITEYPNPTGDDNGDYCGWDPSQEPTGEGLKSIPGVTQPEIVWADIEVATALRNGTEAAAATHGWNFISATGEDDPNGGPAPTIGSVSKSHGYCADDRWIIRIPESLITQQKITGSMHPNRKGHELYKLAIYNKLVADLYTDGIGGPAPATPGDIDSDGDIDTTDIQAINAARNTPATSPDDPRDLDGDGMITLYDARKAVLLCTRPRCATQ